MKHIFRTIFVHPDNDHLNYRLFNGVCFFGAFISCIATAINMSLDMPWAMVFTVIFAGICYSGLFLASRFFGIFKPVQPLFILVSLLSLSMLWFYSQGLTGSVPIFYVFVTFVIMFIIDKSYHFYFGIGLSLNILTLIFLEVYFPQLIIPYPDAITQKWDLGLTYLSMIVFIGSFASFLKSHYHYERDRANEAIQYKAQFLANMSHELRTPLNSLIGFTNILLKNKKQNLDPKQLTYLKRMSFNGNHLLELVNDVLDISKLESGQIKINTEELDLTVFLPEILKQFEPQIKDKGLHLTAEIPQKVLPIQTDIGKLKQILINLLSNAIKFTQEGSVSLKLQTNAQNRALNIMVSDTGSGIPKNKQKLIFETFVQLDNSTQKQHGGTGLGLAISQKLCDILGYELQVKSEEKKGSTFSILLN